MSVLDRLFARTSQNFLAKHQKTVAAINALEETISSLTDEQLRAKTDEFKKILSKRAEEKERDPLAILEVSEKITEKKLVNAALDAILPEAFAVVREAAKRTVGQRHFDVQLLGGIALHQGSIAEMRTGEGKTLVATLPLYLNALMGKGAHLVTVNDYLAKQGLFLYGAVYEFLGLTAAVIVHDQSLMYKNGEFVAVSRREAYAADITYGTNNEYGFDYLRDNMVQDAAELVQRPAFYAIVDEVDSILIDEARTPLIISGSAEESADTYQRFARLVPQLKLEKDYTVDEKDRAVSLTGDGIGKMEQLLGVDNIYGGDEVQLAYHLEEALKAQILFKKDKDYVVREGEVIIVDEFTGRLMPGRRYSEGLHQAIEAKEGVVVQRESTTLATITFQNFFRIYTKLGGMTGTAATEEEEFIKIYGLEVVVIPTNRPMVRKDEADQIFRTEQGKYAAILADLKKRHAAGQPVLIGTISIEKNEEMAAYLKKSGIPHEVLNAKNNEREASIIAMAGMKGGVTLATNIAGRGTDIALGGIVPRRDEFETQEAYDKAKAKWEIAHEEVVSLGGLHVLGTERHESRRIDNQLRGRAGRQGDPGSSQFFVSLDDDLMRIFGGDRLKNIFSALGTDDSAPIEHNMITKSIASAQKRVEGHNFDMRKRVLQYDDVLNRHREVIYRRRRSVMMNTEETNSLIETLENTLNHEARHLVGLHASGLPSDWNIDRLVRDIAALVGMSESDRIALQDELQKFQSDTAVEHRVTEVLRIFLTKKRTEMGEEIFPQVLRSIYLRMTDMMWVEHLNTMKELRDGVGLQGYAQNDPLLVYKAEGFRLFDQLILAIDLQTFRTMLRVERVEETKIS